ncbi:MAG: ABC transporter substrate-binding protein [Nocardioidaceae bacterium]|nr:ABC transporter substrate-binding protein [Nocardioidaceae bacterium]
MAAVALAGCGSKSTGLVESSTVTFSYNGPVTSLWEGTANQYSTYNANVAALTNTGFNYYGLKNGTPSLVKNTNFGSYSEVSKSPLTLKLHVNKGVTWSDGAQVDAADILLSWASGLSKYNNPKGPVNFNAVGAYAGTGLDLLNTPKVDPDGLGMTVSFKKPYVDWEVSVGSTVNGLSPGLPAHIAYELAFPSFKGSATQADAAVQKAILTGDQATMAKLGKVWANSWNVSSMPSDKRLLVSDGPYVVSGFQKNQSISFKRRDDFTGEPKKPAIQNLTLRFITDATSQVQALQNGEVQMIQGQPSTDTVAAVNKLNNVHVDTFAGSSYEHVDLNMKVGNGTFDPATYGGGAAGAKKALMVRQAFLKALPRQEIIDKLIKPLQPDAKIDDSSLFLPGTPAYTKDVATNGTKAYDKTDVAGAKALLKKAGVSNPTVRFTYPNDNPRRVSEYQLIQASEQQAGFNIKPVAMTTAKYFPFLEGGGYDASIFAWQFTSLAYTGNQAAYTSTGGENFNHYSNPQSDKLWGQIASSTGTADQTNALMAKVDKNLVTDAATMPLFQFPEMSAWSTKLSGVSDNPIASGMNTLWDPWDWTVAK